MSEQPPKAFRNTGRPSFSAKIDKNEHIIKKRPPTKPVLAKNHFYISKKQNLKREADRIRDVLLSGEFSDVLIHGLGTSIPLALAASVRVEQLLPSILRRSIRTSTVTVKDDLFPLTDEAEIGVRSRPVSAIHIRLFKE